MVEQIQIPIELLEQFERGNVLLFVGGGINRGVLPSAAELARDLAERCGYRLVQANAHNVLARLSLEEGGVEEARRRAEIGRERAWCDDPPHRYEVAFREAERLLGEMG
jgi:hypothetical protein